MKVAVVTGANKGIGLAIVRAMCKQYDGNVYLTARYCCYSMLLYSIVLQARPILRISARLSIIWPSLGKG